MTKDNKGEYFTYLGETKSVKAWAKDERCAVSESCLRKRIKNGLSFEEAFTNPKHEKSGTKPKQEYTLFGETKSIPQWAEDHRCLVSINTLYARLINYKWTFEKALLTPVKHNSKEIPLVPGQKFGKLILIGKGDRIAPGQQKWLCSCECGNTIQARSWHLRNGNYTSCGCMLKIRAQETFRNYRKNLYTDFPYGFQEVFNTYKKGAKSRNLVFELSKDEFFTLTQNNCYYCNSVPNNKKSREKDFIYNGVDRKNNLEGYKSDNCVSCCKICNVAKNTLSFDEFLEHINKIFNNLKDKNLV